MSDLASQGNDLMEVQPFGGRNVRDVMMRHPKVSSPSTSHADCLHILEDDHVHAVLIVDAAGRLVTVVERPDLAGLSASDHAAHNLGKLTGRTVSPEAPLTDTWRRMQREHRRRLAVVNHDRILVGLLCLKRTGRGFCSDDDVQARAASNTGRGSTTHGRADRGIVCAGAAPPHEGDRRFGISLFAVDTKSERYAIGGKLDKLGLPTSDTADDLSFADASPPGTPPPTPASSPAPLSGWRSGGAATPK